MDDFYNNKQIQRGGLGLQAPDIYGSEFDFSGLPSMNIGLTNNNSRQKQGVSTRQSKEDNPKTNFNLGVGGGGVLGGIGAIGSALANVYAVHQQKKFNKEMLNMEKQRVAKENQRRDAQQGNYDAVWKVDS